MYTTHITERRSNTTTAKYVLIVNGGLYVKGDNTNTFNSLEEVKQVLLKWNGGKNEFSLDEDHEECVTADELIDQMDGDSIDVYEEDMADMGDDYVTLRMEELS